MKLLKYVALVGVLCAAFTGQSARANFTFGDSNDLGQVLFGIPSGDADRTTYVNRLISLAPGTSGFAADGQTYNRSLNNPGPGFPNYPTAIFRLDGTGTSIDLGTGNMYS